MTASLRHAQSILSAAINAGFRESGVQSLKNLDDPNAFPMVAVRTAGLALGSTIGYSQETVNGENEVRAMVSEQYLEMLLSIANARFSANTERIKRFSGRLFAHGNTHGSAWEEPQLRKERMRAEGVKRREQVAVQKDQMRPNSDGEDLDQGPLFPVLDPDGVP